MNRQQFLRYLGWTVLALLALALAIFAVRVGVAIVRLKRQHEAALAGRVDTTGQPDLIRAILERDSAGVEAALQQPGAVNQPSTRGTPPLLLAAERGNARLVQRLLQAGADVEAVDAERYPALAIAARRGDNAVLAALIAGGANPNVQFANTRETPLILAVQVGTASGVRALLGAKADPNLADVAGGTPLMYAVIRDDLTLAQNLLEAGALSNTRVVSPIDGRSRSALELATSPQMRALLERYSR